MFLNSQYGLSLSAVLSIFFFGIAQSGAGFWLVLHYIFVVVMLALALFPFLSSQVSVFENFKLPESDPSAMEAAMPFMNAMMSVVVGGVTLIGAIVLFDGALQIVMPILYLVIFAVSTERNFNYFQSLQKVVTA